MAEAKDKAENEQHVNFIYPDTAPLDVYKRQGEMFLPVGRVNVCVLDGVSGTDHHAIAEIDSRMAHAGSVVGAFEENQITGFCFCLADVLAFLPQAVGGSASHIVAVLVVHPADVA